MTRNAIEDAGQVATLEEAFSHIYFPQAGEDPGMAVGNSFWGSANKVTKQAPALSLLPSCGPVGSIPGALEILGLSAEGNNRFKLPGVQVALSTLQVSWVQLDRSIR